MPTRTAAVPNPNAIRGASGPSSRDSLTLAALRGDCAEPLESETELVGDRRDSRMETSTKARIGAVALALGLLLLAPAASPSAGSLALLALLPATVLLVYGTFLVGTSVEGPVV